MTWILIIWVSGHQLMIPNYTQPNCHEAARIAMRAAWSEQTQSSLIMAYCIPK